MSRLSFAEQQIPDDGTGAPIYPDRYEIARSFCKHLNEVFAGEIVGRGVTEAGLVTQRAADIPAPGTLDVASDAAGDTTQTLTVYGLDGSDNLISEDFILAGVATVSGAVSFTKVLAAVLDAAAVGNVTVDDTVIPTNLFTLAAGVLTRGFAAEAFDADGVLTVSIDTNAVGVQVVVMGLDSAGLAVDETFAMDTAATTPVVGSVAFATITAVLLGDAAAARTVEVTPGDSELTGIPFEPAIVDIYNPDAPIFQRQLPGSSGVIDVNLNTGAAPTLAPTVSVDDATIPTWKITLVRALAPATETVSVLCTGFREIGGSL